MTITVARSNLSLCEILVMILQVAGRINKDIIHYRLDNMGKRSVDEKVVVYGRGSFNKGVIRTRDYCIYNI